MRDLLWVLVLLAVAACQSPPPVGDVLVAQHATADGGQEALRRADAEVRVAQAMAEAWPDSLHAQLGAARALLVAADVRLLVDALERSEGATIDELVASDDGADQELKSAIRGLCSAGLDYARAAEEVGPPCDEAPYYKAFHLSLLAWSEGTSTALLRGRGPELAKLTEKLASNLPELQGAGTQRLRGRFLDRAPWPYGDREQAITALRMAIAYAQTPVNWQFLGDALWANGDRTEALEAWTEGALAAPVPATEYGAPFRRRLNAARVAAAGGEVPEGPAAGSNSTD